jgi:hypothetical protein
MDSYGRNLSNSTSSTINVTWEVAIEGVFTRASIGASVKIEKICSGQKSYIH